MANQLLDAINLKHTPTLINNYQKYRAANSKPIVIQTILNQRI